MAFHVEGTAGVLFETECGDEARTILNTVEGAERIVDGTLDFLRGRAQRKFGQSRRDYPTTRGKDD